MPIAVLLASMTDDQIYASCEMAESVLWFLLYNKRTPLKTRIQAIRKIDRVHLAEKPLLLSRHAPPHYQEYSGGMDDAELNIPVERKESR